MHFYQGKDICGGCDGKEIFRIQQRFSFMNKVVFLAFMPHGSA